MDWLAVIEIFVKWVLVLYAVYVACGYLSPVISRLYKPAKVYVSKLDRDAKARMQDYHRRCSLELFELQCTQMETMIALYCPIPNIHGSQVSLKGVAQAVLAMYHPPGCRSELDESETELTLLCVFKGDVIAKRSWPAKHFAFMNPKTKAPVTPSENTFLV